MELERVPTFRGASGRSSAIRWLDGAFYLPLVLSAVLGALLGVGIEMLTVGKAPILLVIFIAAIGPFSFMAYVLLFRRNKPPGFDADLLATYQFGRDRAAVRVPRPHPLDV